MTWLLEGIWAVVSAVLIGWAWATWMNKRDARRRRRHATRWDMR